MKLEVAHHKHVSSCGTRKKERQQQPRTWKCRCHHVRQTHRPPSNLQVDTTKRVSHEDVTCMLRARRTAFCVVHSKMCVLDRVVCGKGSPRVQYAGVGCSRMRLVGFVVKNCCQHRRTHTTAAALDTSTHHARGQSHVMRMTKLLYWLPQWRDPCGRGFSTPAYPRKGCNKTRATVCHTGQAAGEQREGTELKALVRYRCLPEWQGCHTSTPRKRRRSNSSKRHEK